MTSAPAVPYFPTPPAEYSQHHQINLTRAFETFVAQTRNSFLQVSLSPTATDLSYTAATRVLASSTGTDATLPLVTSGDAGLAPASGGGTTNYLRADGTWAAPPTGGISDGDKGDITVSGGGSTWTVDNGAVTLAKMADMATASLIYRKTAGTGAPEVQTLATLKTDLGLTGTNSGDQTITLTGDVTGSGTGSFAATIANDAVTNAKLANMAANSIKGNNTGGSADPVDLTAAQVRTLINVADGANNYSHPNHTGDVTSVGDGATTIANNAVTLAKMADVATSTVFYRKTAGTGDPEVQTLATLKTDLGLTGTNSGDQTITLTGDVTGSGTGSFAATIANEAVTLAKMAAVATNTVFYRKTAGTGAPEVQTLADLKTDLGLSGTNTGDQSTDLSYTASTRLLSSSTGADVTLPLFTSTDAGLTPLSGGGTTNFLRADGTWAAPPAGGSLALTDLTDVTVSSAAQGQVLTRGASEFQNLTLMTVTLGPYHINDLPGTTTTQATLGYFNTATALSRNGNDMRMDRAGRVVGLIMTSDAARTAGTATAAVRIAGAGSTFDGGSVQLNGTTTTSDSSFVAYGSGVAFTAGQAVGAQVTTSGWTPITANVNIYVVVMFEPF
jgi:hypothetical protein